MEKIDEDLKMYLNKLMKTIETQATFTLGNMRVLNKTRLDDILCCIDVNFPKELKLYKKHGEIDKHVHSFDLYDKLISNIRVKLPLIGKDNYAVNYNESISTIQALIQSFPADVTYIKKTYPNLLED